MKSGLLRKLFFVLMVVALPGGAALAESIYKNARQSSSISNLYADFKARKVGDILTILIVENNSASETSQISTQKSHDHDFKLTHLFGVGSQLFPGSEGDTLSRFSFGADNKFNGQTGTSSAGRVSAQLAAVVKEVLPNGNLLVEGRRAIYINKEQKNIVLTGIVRTQDISSDNTVRSTFIADASITYEGSGEVTNQSRPGFLSRLINLIPIF